jgi:DNA-binding NtrC family response regulator
LHDQPPIAAKKRQNRCGILRPNKLLGTSEAPVQDILESLVVKMDRGGISYREALSEFRKAFVCAALRENKGNLSKAAPALGLHRNTLTRICFELQIDTRSFRPGRRRPPKSALSPGLVKRSVR